MAAGAPGVILLVFLRVGLAGLGALATAIGQVAAGAVPAFAGYADPAVAFTVLLSGTAAVALLLSPGPDRGLACLSPEWHGPSRRGGADPRRVQRGRRRVVRPRKRRSANQSGDFGGKSPACPPIC